MKRIIELKFALFLIIGAHGCSSFIGYLMDGTKYLTLDLTAFLITIVTFTIVFFFAGEKLPEKNNAL